MIKEPTKRAKEWLEADKLDLIKEWCRIGLTNEQLADKIGVSRKTLYNWQNEYQELDQAIKHGKEIADYAVVNALYKNAIGGNVRAQIFWLTNRLPNQWSNKVERSLEQDLGKVEQFLRALEQEAKVYD